MKYYLNCQTFSNSSHIHFAPLHSTYQPQVNFIAIDWLFIVFVLLRLFPMNGLGGQQPTQRLDVCSSMIAANSFYATHCEVQSPSFVRVSQTRKRTTKPNNRLGKIRQECRPDFSIPDPNTSFRCVLLRCGGVWFRGSASHPTAEHSERHTRLCASSPYVEAVRCGVELKLMMLLSRLSDYYRKYFEIEIVIIRSLRDWCGFLAVSFGLDPLVYPKRAWPLALLYGAIQSEVMGTDCRFAGIHGLSS